MSLRIIELGGPAAGYAGKLSARWGSEVIRIDDTSQTPDYPARTEHVAVDHYLHAGTTRVALDFSHSNGLSLLQQLTAQADVIIADLPLARLQALGWSGLGSDKTKIRAAITPFGQTGPRREWSATSSVLLAMGGETFIMGDPGRAPLTVPGRYLDYQAGQYAYTAIFAALRTPTSTTKAIDISQYEVALSLHQFTTVMWTFNERIRTRHGNDFGVIHPITLYPCKDGWWGVNADLTFWDAFTVMLGKPELATDPRFAAMPARIENAAALDAIVYEVLGDKTRAEILELGQVTCRVPTGVASTLPELLADPHLAARGYWQTLAVNGQRLKVPGSAFQFVGEGQPAQGQMQPVIPAADLLDPEPAR